VLYTDAGAVRDAGRVRGRLRELGIRRRVAASPRPAHGWAALTESEVQVARLVGQGQTNREAAARLYLSPHTVSMA
jgi:DNA-binding CsgD family transcriptional regulator